MPHPKPKKLLKPYYQDKRVKVYHGDCLKIVPKIQKGGYDLAFLDPPFNIGQDYDEYQDRLVWDEYKNQVSWWVRCAWGALNDTGVLALHGPDNLCELYLGVAATYKMKRRAWINWHYRFGQNGRHNWVDARCHCLIYSKSKKHKKNKE